MATPGTTMTSIRSIQALAGTYWTVHTRALRMNRSTVLLILMALPSTAVALFLSVLLPHLIFRIEDPALRSGLLTVALSLVGAIWLFVQVFSQRPISWLLDIRPLIQLPFGFNTLYRLRLVGYLAGAWLVALGLAAPYFAVIRSTSVGGFVALTAAICLTVAIQGQIVSIVSWQRDRLVEGLVGSLFVLAVICAMYFGLYWGVLLRTGELSGDDLLGWARDSPLVRAAAWTPAGLLAGMLNDPDGRWENGTRLLGLCTYAILIGICDRELLRRSGLRPASGSQSVKHPTLPLQALLRRLPAVSPGGVLTLIEIESGARDRGLRWSMIIALALFFFLTLVIGSPVLAVIGSLTLACTLLTSHRGERLLPTCRLWSESFALPVTLIDALRAVGRAPSLVAIGFACAALAASFVRFGWFGWLHVGYIVLHSAAGLFFADAAYGWLDARWQTPAGIDGRDHRPGKVLAQNVLGLSVFLPFVPVVLLFTVNEGTPGLMALSTLLAIYVVLAGSAGVAFRASRQRLIGSKGLDALLGRSAESALSATGNNDGDGRHPDGREPSDKHV